MNWYFDTSVLVSAAVTHHPHNSAALTILEEMVTRKHDGHISAHSLTDIYSVLTRTPFEPQLTCDAGQFSFRTLPERGERRVLARFA